MDAGGRAPMHRRAGRGAARNALLALVLLLVPGIGSAQAPSLAEVLSAAMDYTRSDGWVGEGPWHLGIDSSEASRLGPEETAEHRQALARLAAELGVDFHPRDDLRRVVCDGLGCQYPHGQPYPHGQQALSLVRTEVSPDQEVSVVGAHWSMLREPPRRVDGRWVMDYVSVSLQLEVSRDTEGGLRVRELAGIRRHGVAPAGLDPEAPVTSFLDAVAHAEEVLAATVRALAAGGDAIPGDHRLAERLRAALAERDGSIALVMVEKSSSTQRMHPDLNPAALPALARTVAEALRAEGLSVRGATETRTPARPRATRTLRFEDEALAALCPIGPNYVRMCEFHQDLDMVVQLGHPVPFWGGVRLPAEVFREYESHAPSGLSFTVMLSLREGRWVIDQIFVPF
jgi:hypothetical protein